MKKYGVVLIGCGHIGQEHIEDIYYRENIKIVAVTDKSPERARLFKNKYGAEYSDTDYLPYLKNDEVDIVIIASPASTHLDILKDCIRYGKNVLCEKPIATNEKDGEEFFKLWKNADIKISVGHILRYNKTFIKVKELINSGVIGNLKTVRMIQNHHILDAERYHTLLKDCSPLVDCGIHYYDLLEWITGSKIVEVGGFGNKVDTELDDIHMDYTVANLFLENGVTAYYEAGWCRSINSSNVKEFIGDKGGISVTLKRFRSEHTEEGDLIEIFDNESGSYRSINVKCDYKPMYAQISNLIDCIEGKQTQGATAEEVFHAFKVGLAADRAAQAHTVIKL